MKIINASQALTTHIGSEINFLDNKPTIKFGSKPMSLLSMLFALIAIAGFAGGIGAGLLAIVIMATLDNLLLKKPVDNRVEYTIEKIGNAQNNIVSTKSAGGSIGSAAVGGLLFGGAGAIVGAVAGGNNILNIQNIVVKFTNGDWVVLEGDLTTTIDKMSFKNLVGMAHQDCPI